MSTLDSAWKTWYRGEHDKRCLLSGTEFEKYAAALLERFHQDDFYNPDPMGRFGDGGCDGLAKNGSICYACYGQSAKTDIDAKTRNKLISDFDRAVDVWNSFTTWIFVTNALLGPSTLKSLQELRQRHSSDSKRPINLKFWRANEDLWWKVANKLSLNQLNEVLPGVPHYQDVELSDLAELLNALEGIPISPSEALDSIKPVPETKMDYNNISDRTRLEFKEGRLLYPRINNWFSEQAAPNLRDEKAKRFQEIYRVACKDTNDALEIVERIYVAIGGRDPRYSTRRANAVYAITVYFFDSCDIFEEPPEDYRGGGTAGVTSI